MFPGESDYRSERTAFLATIESLTRDELDNGTTLCEGWTPRDVLSHLLGIDEAPLEYAKAFGNVTKGNARIVARMRALSSDELLERARGWAAKPAFLSLTASFALVGDVSIHHQDVIRGLGRRRDVPPAIGRAILREGSVLGIAKLRRYRVQPTDTGRPRGRGTVVRGTAEALGMWLAGRRVVEPELVFATAD